MKILRLVLDATSQENIVELNSFWDARKKAYGAAIWSPRQKCNFSQACNIKKSSGTHKGPPHRASEIIKLIINQYKTRSRISHLHLKLFQFRFLRKIDNTFVNKCLFLFFRFLLWFSKKFSWNYKIVKIKGAVYKNFYIHKKK